MSDKTFTGVGVSMVSGPWTGPPLKMFTWYSSPTICFGCKWGASMVVVHIEPIISELVPYQSISSIIFQPLRQPRNRNSTLFRRGRKMCQWVSQWIWWLYLLCQTYSVDYLPVSWTLMKIQLVSTHWFMLASFVLSIRGLPWWPCGVKHYHRLQAVSHCCPGSNPTRGMWESCQWLGVRHWFSTGIPVSSTS